MSKDKQKIIDRLEIENRNLKKQLQRYCYTAGIFDQVTRIYEIAPDMNAEPVQSACKLLIRQGAEAMRIEHTARLYEQITRFDTVATELSGKLSKVIGTVEPMADQLDEIAKPLDWYDRLALRSLAKQIRDIIAAC